MSKILQGMMALVLGAAAAFAQAGERDEFLQHQYRSQCLAFAQDPEGFRQQLETGDLRRLPAPLVRQLLMGQDDAQGWSLAYQGRLEYLLVLAEDEARCAIIARHADAETTQAWFEQLVTRPPAGYRVERQAPSEGDQRYAGDARVQRWIWQGPDRVLEHGLMTSARADAPLQAVLSLTLTTKMEP